jgi:hypothetical protein
MVFGVLITMSPLTSLSAVPAGTPVQVEFGYPGSAQAPLFGGFAGGAEVSEGDALDVAVAEGDGDAETVAEGVGWGVPPR